MKTTLYTLVIESSDKGTSAQSFLTEEARQDAFHQWMRRKDPERAEEVLALPSDEQRDAVDDFLHDVGGFGGDYVSEQKEEIDIPAPPKLTALARMIARLTITGDEERDSLDANSVRILRGLALEALAEEAGEAQPDVTPGEPLDFEVRATGGPCPTYFPAPLGTQDGEEFSVAMTEAEARAYADECNSGRF